MIKKEKNDQKFYQAYLDSLSIAISIQDDHFHYKKVNKTFCNLFGMTATEVIGKTTLQNVPEAKWQTLKKIDRKVLTTGNEASFQMRLKIHDRTTRLFQIRKIILYTEEEEKMILTRFEDIEEKSVLMRELRISEKKYKTIFNLAPDPASIFTYPEKIGVDVNRAYLKLAGVSRRSIIGHTGHHAYKWVDNELMERCYAELLKKGSVESLEIRLMLGTGEIRTFLLSMRMITINRKLHLMSSFKDISDLKMAQEAIVESEELYRTFFDYSPNVVMIHKNNELIYVNDVLRKSLGCEQDLLIGKRLESIFTIPSKKTDKANISRLFVDPVTTTDKEVRFVCCKGDTHDFFIRNTPIKYKGEDACLSILTDITERKNVERYVLGKIFEAEETERKRYAADLHDDLGPILATIRMRLSLLCKQNLPASEMEEIKTCNDLLHEVIDKLHLISHNITPHLLEDYGLEASIKHLLELITGKDGTTIEYNSNLGKQRFPTETELHIYRMISELLTNTLKHSGASKIHLKINYSKQILDILYMDNGIPYIVEKLLERKTGMGILNLHQRARLFGAELSFTNKKGHTFVNIRKKF
jgi:PAS domain S-box-containing protein